MIAKKIYEQAKLHVDDDFNWLHARRWLNEAMREIAVLCENGSKIMETITVISTQADYYSIPSESIGVANVYIDSVNRDNRVDEYIEDGNRVWLPEEGLYYIEYYRPAKDLVLESDTPEVHEMYHIPMSYWVASNEKYRFNPQDADAARLKSEFYSQITRVDKMLAKNSRRRKIKL